MARERLVEQTVQARAIKAQNRLVYLLPPSQPGTLLIAVILHQRLAADKDASHLAHCNAALQPAEDVADIIDIGLGVQAMATVGTGGQNEPITALPGAQGHRVYARQAGDFTNREQLLVLQSLVDRRGTSLFAHLH
ncbi:hypothetical protein D3C80_1304770 [compost metagenome]